MLMMTVTPPLTGEAATISAPSPGTPHASPVEGHRISVAQLHGQVLAAIERDRRRSVLTHRGRR
jgi:hypothetical protein